MNVIKDYLPLLQEYWWVLAIIAIVIVIWKFSFFLSFIICSIPTAFIVGTIVSFIDPSGNNIDSSIEWGVIAVGSFISAFFLNRYFSKPLTSQERRDIERSKEYKRKQRIIKQMIEERAGLYCKNCSYYTPDGNINLYYGDKEVCSRSGRETYAYNRGCGSFDLIDDLWNEAEAELRSEGRFRDL